jgi:RNA polymerase sigma-54 factor
MHTKLSIRPQMSISPQLVITGRLLQVPASELEQFISMELTANPALELANNRDRMKSKLEFSGPGYPSTSFSAHFSTRGSYYASPHDDALENIVQNQSPLEKLVEQVSLIVSKKDRDIAVSLLHRLDDRGFLLTPTEQLASELMVSTEKISQVIGILHQLEPPGIGARNIRECFLIQCSHLEAEAIDCELVRRILTLAWSEFLKQQWDRVAKKINAPKQVIKDACDFMRINFCPHPLAMADTSIENDKTLNYADLIIRRDYSADIPAFSLEIPGEADFELKMSTAFQEVLVSKTPEETRLSEQERMWIRVHAEKASMLIIALRQRWETLRRIGQYLIEYQSGFLEHGPRFLRPLTRASLARKLNVHESTISRAVSQKTIQLPNGHLIPLSDFFDPSLAAKEAIRQLIKENSRAVCDREIAESLQANGINISRRTISKYRQKINLDSSRRQTFAI